MSTGLECSLIEVEPSQWMLLLEDGSAPKQAWDWREFATSYGMFATEAETQRFLSTHFANPGGYGIQEFEAGWKPDEVMVRLIAEARASRARVERSSLGGGGWRR